MSLTYFVISPVRNEPFIQSMDLLRFNLSGNFTQRKPGATFQNREFPVRTGRTRAIAVTQKRSARLRPKANGSLRIVTGTGADQFSVAWPGTSQVDRAVVPVAPFPDVARHIVKSVAVRWKGHDRCRRSITVVHQL